MWCFFCCTTRSLAESSVLWYTQKSFWRSNYYRFRRLKICSVVIISGASLYFLQIFSYVFPHVYKEGEGRQTVRGLSFLSIYLDVQMWAIILKPAQCTVSRVVIRLMWQQGTLFFNHENLSKSKEIVLWNFNDLFEDATELGQICIRAATEPLSLRCATSIICPRNTPQTRIRRFSAVSHSAVSSL